MYELPALPYDYKALAPFLSEEQLQIHHDKHHKAYVDKANEVLGKLEIARKEGSEIDVKAVSKNLSFQAAGVQLHSLFWSILLPKDKTQKQPTKIIGDEIKKEFGSYERFVKEFSDCAVNCEGSGWAALTYSRYTNRLFIMQIEKHNVNVIPAMHLLLVLDVWEHAYYIDYKNDRAKYVQTFFDYINWQEVEMKLGKAILTLK